MQQGGADAHTFTLSFYAKAVNKTGVYSVQCLKKDAAGAGRYQVKDFTVTTAWVRFEITFEAYKCHFTMGMHCFHSMLLLHAGSQAPVVLKRKLDQSNLLSKQVLVHSARSLKPQMLLSLGKFGILSDACSCLSFPQLPVCGAACSYSRV